MTSSSLKKRAVSGTIWTLGGYGASQFIRLISNVWLTRLVSKDLIGIMALVSVLMIGLAMFSDVGIGPSIIQDKKGNDPKFLNTAWTVQIVRGLCLWLCACLIAYPFSIFYEDPLFLKVIPVASLAAVLHGFNSTSVFTSNRELALAKLTLLEIISQVISVIVIITWATLNPTIWAIVFGSLTKDLVKMLLTHFWLPGMPNRFCWDKAMVKRLVRFGRWIFISTAIAFVLQYVDRLVVGKFMTLDKFAVYSVASTFAVLVDQIYRKMSNQVLFPLYAKIRDLPKNELRQRVRKVRLGLMGALLPPLCFLLIFGPNVIDILYPETYSEGGWMLQVLSIGWIIPVSTLLGPVCLGFGESFQHMRIDAIRGFILVASMILGGLFYDIPGLIWGIAIADAIYYPFVIGVYRRYSLWFPDLDLLAIVIATTVSGIGLFLTGNWQPIWQSIMGI